MGILGWLDQLLNFALPGLVLAVWVPLSLRWTSLGRRAMVGLPAQMAVLAALNATVLVAGLLWFGQDGRMASYLAMVVASGSAAWLLLRAWRT